LRRLLPLLLVLAASLAAPSAASAAPEAGLNVAGGTAVTTDQIDRLAATGATWARHFVFQDDINQAGIEKLKSIIAYERSKGIGTLLVVTRVDHRPPPAAEFAAFMARIAAEFRGQAKQIAYEIWNEQDEALWWNAPGGPNPANYLDMLRQSYNAVKTVDPSATVVLGPLTGNNYGWLERMYDANGGSALPADAVAVHTDTACLIDSPYDYYRDTTAGNRIARFTFLGIKEVRNTLVAAGDAKPVWVTELGWQVSDRTCAYGMWAGKKKEGVTEAQQAQFLSQAYHCLASEPYVPVALWFTDHDPGYGLYDHPLTLEAFKRYTSRGDELTGPCGDFVPPELEILSPKPGAVFTDASAVPVSVRSKDGETRKIMLDVQSAGGSGRVMNWGNPSDANGIVAPIDYVKGAPQNCLKTCRYDWHWSFKDAGGAMKKVPDGKVQIVASASDQAGNIGTATVEVNKVDPSKLPAQRPKFRKLKLGGKGRVRKLTIQVGSAIGLVVDGVAYVEWQNRRRGKWKKIHGGATHVDRGGRNRAVSFRTVRLKYRGKWRVRVKLKAQRPFRSMKTKWVRFRV
jgi:hypothetical protein